MELFLSAEKYQTNTHSFGDGKLIVDRKLKVEVDGVRLKAIIEGDPVKYLGGTPWKETSLEEALFQLDSLFARVEIAKVSRTQGAHLLNDYAVPALLAKLEASRGGLS